MFASWGRLVYRRRWTVLLASCALLLLSLAAVAQGGTFMNSSSGGEAGRASDTVSREMPHTDVTLFDIILSSRTIRAKDRRFQEAVAGALSRLRADRRVAGIVTPYSTVARPNNRPGLERGQGSGAERLFSTDGHKVLAVVTMRDSGTAARREYPLLRRLVHSTVLTVRATGGIAISADFDRYLNHDLHRAETVSLPFALLLLLVVFGSIVAALLPLGVGILAIVGGIGGTLLLTHATDVSQYALNIVTLIGLGDETG